MTEKNYNKTEDVEIDLLQLFGEMVDHKWLIASVTALCTAAAVGYALMATPIYKADTLIQVEQKRGNALLSSLNELMPSGSKESAPEIELIKSRMILGKTVDDLSLRTQVKPKYFPVVGKGWARLTHTEVGAIDVPLLNIAARGADRPIYVLTVGEGGSYTLQDDMDGDPIIGQVGQVLEHGPLEIKVSDIAAEPGAQFVIAQDTELEVINHILENFDVSELAKDSGMLQLTLKGEDPDKIVKILSNIANNYVQQNIDRQAAQNTQSLVFLETQLPDVRSKLDVAEDKLYEYRRNREAVDLSLEAKSVLDQIVNVENQINQATFREAEISQHFKKDHPTYKALLDKKRTLESEKQRLNDVVAALPGKQQEILRLSRDVELGRAVYMQLLNRQQELSIAKASAVGNVRVVDAAMVQPKPVSPKKVQVVFIGLLIGLVLSMGWVTLRFVLRRGVETPDVLEEQGINVYATVPYSDELAHARKRELARRKNSDTPPFLLPVDSPGDVAVEAVRALRTSLHFAMMESNNNNILMITSPAPNGGKSFISTTLATIMAQAGQRVLFIDADMRLSYLNKVLRLPRTEGLSDYLSGQLDIASAVQRFERGGFDCIAEGTTPPNPSELLMHPRFRALLEWANANYDFIVVDTPPVLAVTDAAIVGRLAGATLLVVRYAVNTLQEVMVSIQRLEQGGVNIKGAILNGVLRRASHGYGYGYGYGEYSKSSKKKSGGLKGLIEKIRHG